VPGRQCKRVTRFVARANELLRPPTLDPINLGLDWDLKLSRSHVWVFGDRGGTDLPLPGDLTHT